MDLAYIMGRLEAHEQEQIVNLGKDRYDFSFKKVSQEDRLAIIEELKNNRKWRWGGESRSGGKLTSITFKFEYYDADYQLQIGTGDIGTFYGTIFCTVMRPWSMQEDDDDRPN
jgi:hypothetical protein